MSKKQYPFKTIEECAEWCSENGNPFETKEKLSDWLHEMAECPIFVERPDISANNAFVSHADCS